MSAPALSDFSTGDLTYTSGVTVVEVFASRNVHFVKNEPTLKGQDIETRCPYILSTSLRKKRKNAMREIKVTQKMSTNKKKLYTSADIELAKADNEAVKKYFARRGERRKTMQVRVSEKWHRRLKDFSKSEKTIMSFLLDEICKHFFSNYQL